MYLAPDASFTADAQAGECRHAETYAAHVAFAAGDTVTISHSRPSVSMAPSRLMPMLLPLAWRTSMQATACSRNLSAYATMRRPQGVFAAPAHRSRLSENRPGPIEQSLRARAIENKAAVCHLILLPGPCVCLFDRMEIVGLIALCEGLSIMVCIGRRVAGASCLTMISRRQLNVCDCTLGFASNKQADCDVIRSLV